MPPTTVHIINHTHWDREWFTTALYTSAWIPGLIDQLEALVAENLNFQFLLDGQTLVIEDLLQRAPAYHDKIRHLVGSGNLLIGPYYCQPDWRLVAGELLMRNLEYGLYDARKWGATQHVGWLVDTFGHVSQAPQMHQQYGIEAVFVWRGVPQLVPYFQWHGADNTTIFGVNLFGGYRNLYGLTHVPAVAGARLAAEVERLRSYFSTGDIPLFDGYDLEDNPEDPFLFFQNNPATIPTAITVQENSPFQFVADVNQKLEEIPNLYGELQSGKYGATFPGTLSARVYLKLMQYDISQLLFQVCEPLAALAWLNGRPYPAEQFENWGRLLLQNAVHDCICGVSIDQVHERMEDRCRAIYSDAQRELTASIDHIMQQVPGGLYAINTTPYPVETVQAIGNRLYHLSADGLGVFPVLSAIPLDAAPQTIHTFTWQNKHYTATLQPDGTLMLNGDQFGKLIVTAEHGDTYTNEPGERLGMCTITEPPMITQRSDQYCRLRFSVQFTSAQLAVNAHILLCFDQSPQIKWDITLDSSGAEFSVALVFAPQAAIQQVHTGMPFDLVERPLVDDDLLLRELPPELQGILLGQREVGAVRTFPFQEVVGLTTTTASVALFARGVYAYEVTEDNTLTVTLRRAVEWLTQPDLGTRVGDAGPFFYVPDARCERTLTHHFALYCTPNLDLQSADLQRELAIFRTPPLLVEKSAAASQQRRIQAQSWRLDVPQAPLSSLTVKNAQLVARFYNPTTTMLAPELPPKKIVLQRLPIYPLEKTNGVLSEDRVANVRMLTPLQWRFGDIPDTKPSAAILDTLSQKIADIETKLRELEYVLQRPENQTDYVLQHQYYILKRESLEYQLTQYLNRQKLKLSPDEQREARHQVDEQLAQLSIQLNQMRIKRRIFDYIVNV